MKKGCEDFEPLTYPSNDLMLPALELGAESDSGATSKVYCKDKVLRRLGGGARKRSEDCRTVSSITSEYTRSSSTYKRPLLTPERTTESLLPVALNNPEGSKVESLEERDTL